MVFTEEKMAQIGNFFKKTLEFPIIWLGGFYLFWFLWVPTETRFTFGLSLLGIYLVIIVLEKLSSANKIISTALFILLLPVAGIASLLILELVTSTAGWLDREFIYGSLIMIFSSFISHRLSQENLGENKLLRILLFIVTLPILAINISYPVTYFPKVLDQKEFNNFKYYIIWELDIDYHSYLSFYKCEKWSFECKALSRAYMEKNFDKIIIDQEKNEVSVVRTSDAGLAFTDGDNPRKYDGNPVILGGHVYQMAIDFHGIRKCIAKTGCDSYIYALYECNLDYTSCDMLPIQYYSTDYDYGWIYLEVNEATNEIKAYNRNDTLIFTYGAHTVCYVDNCSVLAH